MRDYKYFEGLLYGDLGLDPDDRNEMYLSDMFQGSAFKQALASSFLKKLCPLGTSPIADDNALKKFRAINEKVGTWKGFEAMDEAESCFWDYLKDNFRKALGWSTEDIPHTNEIKDPSRVDGFNYDLDFIMNHISVGPGSAQLADSDTMCTKLFCGEMSHYGSEYLVSLYRSALSKTGLWAEAERLRFSKYGFTKVAGGKLFFAKKNAAISRTCCTEANLEMLIQRSLGDFVEMRLKRAYGISLGAQPDYNRELARRGSIDGSFGTIDLVSASDSISTLLFELLMEDGFTKAIFLESRSKFAVLPDGSEIGLNMISTMGNGYTFPLQTLIFASVVRSVYQLMGFPCSDPSKQFGVFGDDIIVRKEAYVFTCRMLNKLGFEVNAAKSFNTGPFRESCGEDYFLGTDIRGVYVQSLETPQQVCSCINRLIRWSARSGTPLKSLISALKVLVPKAPYVPPSVSDDMGIHVPFRLTYPEVSDTYWFRYRYYKRRFKKRVMPEPDDSMNPPGFGLSFLSGHTRRKDVLISDIIVPLREVDGVNGGLAPEDVHITIRDKPNDVIRYRVAKDLIPWWDYFPKRSSRDTTSYSDWESAVTVVLA